MNAIKKTAMRAAVLIHERLCGRQGQDATLYLPEHAWNNIRQLGRQIGMARQRGWHGAVSRLTKNLAYAIDDHRRQLDNASRILQSQPMERQVCSASDIFRDILALYDEFEEVAIDLNEHTLAVTTDRIVLDDVNLGPFKIRLDWHGLCSSDAYRVVALDPHPASKSEDITHPHVQDERLCEGEGRAAIHVALAECRLHDFFMLVDQVLHTYGRGSAYVELDRWDNIPCEECGDTVDEDDSYYCHRCEATLCGSCSVSREGCGDSYCSGCLSRCAACGHDHCSSCLAICPLCHKRFCDDCLAEGGLCRTCHDEQRNEEKKMMIRRRKKLSNNLLAEPRRAAAAELPAFRREKPQASPTLRFSPTAWAKLLYLRDFGDTEVGGFGISAADDLLHVQDVQLVRQVCTGVSVCFDDQSVAEFFDRQVDQGRNPQQFGRVMLSSPLCKVGL